MSLAQGFMQGWGLMDNHYQNEYRKERDAKQDARLAAQDKMASDRHKTQMDTFGLQNEMAQKQLDTFDENYQLGLDAKSAQIAASNANVAASKTRGKYDSYRLDEAKKAATNKEALSAVNAMLATGQFAPFSENEAIMQTDFALLDDPEMRAAIQRVAQAFETGKLSGVAADFNRAFKSKLNRMVGKAKGRDGGDILDVEVVGIDPVENGQFKFRVNVTTDKGRYQSYISELRSGDPDDPEKKFDAEAVTGKIAELAHVGKVMDATGYNQMMAQRSRDYINNMGMNPKGAVAQGMPAKVQEYEYIRSLFGNDGLERMLFASRTKDPMAIRQTAIKMATDIVSSDPASMGLSKDEKVNRINSIGHSLMSTMNNGFGNSQQGGGGLNTGQPDPFTQQAQALLQALEQAE